MNGAPEAAAATEANGEPTVREASLSADPAPSPRSRADQEAALATAVGHLSRQDVADVLQRQGTGSDDGDWDYELEHYDQVGRGGGGHGNRCHGPGARGHARRP